MCVISLNQRTKFFQKSASLGTRFKLRYYQGIQEAWTENKKHLHLEIAQELFLAWQKPAKIHYKMGEKDSSSLKIITCPYEEVKFQFLNITKQIIHALTLICLIRTTHATTCISAKCFSKII